MNVHVFYLLVHCTHSYLTQCKLLCMWWWEWKEWWWWYEKWIWWKCFRESCWTGEIRRNIATHKGRNRIALPKSCHKTIFPSFMLKQTSPSHTHTTEFTSSAYSLCAILPIYKEIPNSFYNLKIHKSFNRTSNSLLSSLCLYCLHVQRFWTRVLLDFFLEEKTTSGQKLWMSIWGKLPEGLLL